MLSFISCRNKGRVVEPKYDNAHATLQQSTHNFGTLSFSQHEVDHEFTLINDGGEKLEITNVVNHCHCTYVDYDHAPIKPGHATTLKVYLDVDDLSTGSFIRDIDVETNGGTVRIMLEGQKE